MREQKPLKSNNVRLDKVYQPMPGYVLIESQIPTKTEAGILIPEASRTVDAFAVVVAVGEGVTAVKIGDEVLLKSEAHEIVPSKRVVILTRMHKDIEIYYVQITVGTIMGKTFGNFKEMAKKSYQHEFEKAEKADKKAKAPKIIVPKQDILTLK